MPKYANNGSLMIMAITKAVICVIIVGSVCFCLVTGRNLEGRLLEVILAIVGIYFGMSAKTYQESTRNKYALDGRVARAIERMRQAELNEALGRESSGSYTVR